MIGNAHPNCQYIWKSLDRQELLFPDSPVIFVKLAAVYKGAVFVKGNQVCSTVFDVCQSLTGAWEISIYEVDNRLLCTLVFVDGCIAGERPGTAATDQQQSKLSSSCNKLFVSRL